VLSAVVSNSAAAFAILLGCVLVGLAIGAWIAARLDVATRWAPIVTVQIALGLVVVSIGTFQDSAFLAITAVRGWFHLTGLAGGLVSELIASGALTLVPSVLLGLVLPLLFNAWPGGADAAGRRWGHLVALSTAGAVAGSALTTAALIPWLHVAGTTIALGGTNVFLGLLLWRTARPESGVSRFAVAALFAGIAALVLLLPGSPPLAGGHRLLARSEGVGANVSVTGTYDGERSLVINDRYVAGGTEARMLDYRQALIPALLHPRPARVFHLGLGTGQTAGVLARTPGVERLVTCETIPGVVDAAREWFAESNLGLFSNPVAEIAVADGRHWLGTSDEKFDLIVIDNLLPWLSGTGHIYTREHFEILRAHLAPGGLVCVWLPLHQIDERQIALVHRTLGEVFPTVHLWLARPDLETSVGLIAADGTLSLEHLFSDPRFADSALSQALEDAHVTDPSDVFAGLCGVDAIVADERAVHSTDDRAVFEAWAVEILHGDLALHPTLHSSPAMLRNWTVITEIRRRSTEDLQRSIERGLDQASESERERIERVWRRWLNQSDLAEGLAALCRGDQQVERHFLRAADRDPGDPLPRLALDWLLITLVRAEQWSDAVSLGEGCKERFDLSSDARVGFAMAQARRLRPHRARLILEEVLREDPDHVEAALELIRILVESDRAEEAMTLLTEMHGRHPDHSGLQRLWEKSRSGDSGR
jgi:spermidine synthase